MGLEVNSSVIFWQRSQPEETPQERRLRALSEKWYPALSEARVRYLLGQFEKRFPPAALSLLKPWGNHLEQQAPLICHWHLQWSDPLYRDFTSSYLVETWAKAEAQVSVTSVDLWLVQRGGHTTWSESTRRRLASGLLTATKEAGFLLGQGREKTLRPVTVSDECLAYLRRLLALNESPSPLGEELFLSGTVPA